MVRHVVDNGTGYAYLSVVTSKDRLERENRQRNSNSPSALVVPEKIHELRCYIRSTPCSDGADKRAYSQELVALGLGLKLD
jgi:hypothetical protein